MSEWKEYKLSEITTKIGSGATPRGGQESYKNEGISLIRSQNILDFEFSSSGLAFIDDVQASQLSNVEVLEEDILLNITGDSVARVCKVPRSILPARVNQHVSIIRAKKSKVIPNYILYYLLNPLFKKFMLMIASDGATRNALTKGEIEGFDIRLPPKEIQSAIASVLSNLDSKIDLLRKKNQTLENIAQTLFKRWFVDFEFPNEDGKPYKSSGGKMVESEFGEIPEGWSNVNLIDIANVVDCSHSKKPSQVKEGRFLLQVYNIGKYGHLNLNEKYYVSDNDYIEWTKRIEVREGDMIISKTGRVGAIAQIPVNIKAGLGRNLVAIIAKEIIDHVYLKDLMLSNFMRREIKKGTNAGTILSSLHVKEINQLSCYLPRKHNLDGYKNVTLPIQKEINENLWHIQTLTELRDTLLPRLMSGQIRVKGL